MSIHNFSRAAIFATCSFALASGSALASASASDTANGPQRQQATQPERVSPTPAQPAQPAQTQQPALTGQATTTADDVADAIGQVSEASSVLRQMKLDPELTLELEQAEGVFVLTDYGRAALGVGIRGGQGVLLVNRDGDWGTPLFYNFGGISAGLQAGVEGGRVAMILTNPEAMRSFMEDQNWSLNVDAGLTIINWAIRGQAAAGTGDVIVWSDAAGLLGDLAISVTNIVFDEEDTAAFYGQPVTMQQVIAGEVRSPHAIAGLDE